MLFSAAASAQESFTSLGGVWWFELGGDDRGALLLGLSEPHNGSVETLSVDAEQSSLGYSEALDAFFLVPAGQTLTLDSNGSVAGVLALVDPDDGASLGTLTLERGDLNAKYTRWQLRTSIETGTSGPVAGRLRGERLPDAFPVLSGSNPETQLSGEGVRSRAFDLHVVPETALGLPVYEFDGAGSVEIDGTETPGVTMSGTFMLSPRHKLFGRLETSSAFGVGDVTGSLAPGEGSWVPRIRLRARAERQLKLRGKLDEPLEPVLSVTPTSFDFGASHLGERQDRTFEVSNVGAGALSGEARFLAGSSADFGFVGDASYVALTPGATPQRVTLSFRPSSAGTKTAQVRFEAGSGRVGAQIVTLSGVGGIAEIEVTPTQVAFPDTAIGVSAFETVTVENVGDGALDGAATLSGSPAFRLSLSAGGIPRDQIDYSLAPGAALSFVVSFRPVAAGDQTGSLTLTGGGGATLTVSGGTP